MSRSRKILAGLHLLAITTLLMLVVAEAFLRIAYPVSTSLYKAHPERHFSFRPGAKKLHVHHADNGGSKHLIRIDAQGFRGTGVSAEKSKPRLAVYGDSFVAAEYAPVEDSFCGQLSQALDQQWEVINAGITGYGSDQSLLKMEAECAALDPDALLFLICCENDTIDLLRNRLLRPDAQGKLQATGATLPPHLYAQLEPPIWHPRRLHLLKLGVRVLRNLRAPSAPPVEEANAEQSDPANPVAGFLAKADQLYRGWIEENDLQATHIVEDFYDIALALEPDSEATRFKAALLTGIYARMQAVADRQQIPLHIIAIPSVIDSLPNYPDPLARGLRAHPDYDPTRLTRVHTEILSGLSMSHFDLYPAFRESPQPLFYLQHDSHWNAAGQALAAQLVAKEFFLSDGAAQVPN